VLDERCVGRLGLRASIGVLACPGASNVGAIRRAVAVGCLQVGAATEGPVNRCSSLSLLEVDISLKVRCPGLSLFWSVAEVLNRGVPGEGVDGDGVVVVRIVNGEAPCANASIRLRSRYKNFFSTRPQSLETISEKTLP